MYKVTCLYDGATYILHDPESEVLRIYDDELVTESNSPASFKFSVAYDHPYLDKIVGLSSDIRVYDDGEEIFRGRPIDDGEDLYRTRTFQCEGELAFLYDSIQPRRELHDITPLEFFTLLVEEHNAQVEGQGPIDKTFEVGTVTVTDSNDSLYRYTNRETTLDDILEKIVDRLGGHLSVRISGSTRYLDLLADVETVGDQPVQLGENLLTYAKDTDYTEIATACIPLGASQEETEIAALDAYLTIADVNDGSEVIQLSDAVDRYGFICKVLNYDDMTVASNLKTAGEEWLQDGQYANMTLSLTAVDLHNLGYDMQPIRADTQVRVVSEPHGMDRYFEVTARTYHLTQPEQDTVTFGTTEKKTYTSSAKSSVSAVASHSEQVRQNIDSVIEKERDNISDILNQATHGYVVLDPNDGPERILIMDTNDVDTAQKIWKWDMNGLGYSSSGIDGPWGVAITMNGEISADFILTGELYAGLIKTGILSDVEGKNYWNMETGEFSLSASTTVGGSTVTSIAEDAAEAAAEEAVENQTQDDIFNKLTNNGETQGIYLSDGKVYINATYIKSGILADTNGNTTWDLSTGELTMKKGSINIANTFIVDTSGNVTANSLLIKDGFSIYNDDTEATVFMELHDYGTDQTAVTIGENFTYVQIGKNVFIDCTSDTQGGYVMEISGSSHEILVEPDVYLENETFISTHTVGYEDGNSYQIYLIGCTNHDNIQIGKMQDSESEYTPIRNIFLHTQNLYKTTSGSDTSLSDERYKKDIADMNNAEAFIMGLSPKWYKFTDGTSGRIHAGFLAGEVKEDMDETVGDFGVYVRYTFNEEVPIDENDPETYICGLRYEELIAPHIAVTQMHNQKILELNQELQELQAQNEQLKAQLESLALKIA